MIVLGSIQSAINGPAGLPIAFLVGMVSFFSPCVLPVVPGYLSFISGVSGQELEEGNRRGRVTLASLLFVGGFGFALTSIGAVTTVLAGAYFRNKSAVERIAGAIVMLMGFVFLTSLAIKPLLRWKAGTNGFKRGVAVVGLKVASIVSAERGLHPRATGSIIGAFPLGAAMGITWTPCVGPGYGAILTLASSRGEVGKGIFLLIAFSLGFGVWFVLAGFGFNKMMKAFGVLRRHMRAFVLAGGLFMVVIGLLMVTSQWNNILAPIRRLIQNFSTPI